MKTRWGAVLFAVLMATPAIAGIYVDYDPTADVTKYKTFKWVDKPGTSLQYHDQLLHSRVKHRIESELTERGYVLDEADPDLLITYHASSKEEFSVNIASFGYAYGPSWAWDPYWHGAWGYGAGMSTTAASVRSYGVGTLLIDIVDAEKNQLIWRGSATGIVVPENPHKLGKKVLNSIEKIIAKWEKMKKKAQ
jgi:hypothetical protein